MAITKENKKSTVKKIASSDKNTGDTSVQIALLTDRIKHLSEHLKGQKKDFVTQRSLIKMVNQRRALLNYLKGKDLKKYRDLIKTLDIRK